MVKRRRVRALSAVERRIHGLAPSASSLPEAVKLVASELLDGVHCPPTNLETVGQRIGVQEIVYESFPGSGELHRVKQGFRIVCSSDQSTARQRFTIAHELAHVVLERTGRNAPRTGKLVERVCDMLAAEFLMPTSVFEDLLPAKLTISGILELAAAFHTSVTTTAIRCAELRPICVFGVTERQVTWGYGGVRPGAVEYLMDQVRDNVRHVMAGQEPAKHVYFYADGSRAIKYCSFDWRYLGPDRALFLLVPENASSTGVRQDRQQKGPARTASDSPTGAIGGNARGPGR